MVAPALILRFLPHALVLLGILGAGLYVLHLRDTVNEQAAALQQKEEESVLLRAQVQDLTRSYDEVQARQELAQEAARKLREDLAKARSRIKNAPIPSDCPGGVEFFREWLSR